MHGAAPLEVIVSLIGLFFVYSLLVSQMVEIISVAQASRARFLKEAVLRLLGPKLGQDVLNHPLIKSLSAGPRGASYIEGTLFSKALLDCYYNPAQPEPTKTGDSPEEISRRLAHLISPVVGDPLEQARKQIEDWFNQAMDRVSGAYKRHAQRVSLAVAAVLVISTNADALHLASILMRNPELAQQLSGATLIAADLHGNAKLSVTPADKSVDTEEARKPVSGPALPPGKEPGKETGKEPGKENGKESGKEDDKAPPPAAAPTPTPPAAGGAAPSPQAAGTKGFEPPEALSEFLRAVQPWSGAQIRALNQTPSGWFFKIVGLLLTILAVAMGAPFWFDLLTRLAPGMRMTGPPPKKEAPGSSEG